MPHSEDNPGPSLGVSVTPIPQTVVRCACEQCGAHTNALWSLRVGGSCPTCGSFRLTPIKGAKLMLDAGLIP
jgi:Zn finger protein HypA/HybF involved in hydrogenase expression